MFTVYRVFNPLYLCFLSHPLLTSIVYRLSQVCKNTFNTLTGHSTYYISTVQYESGICNFETIYPTRGATPSICPLKQWLPNKALANTSNYLISLDWHYKPKWLIIKYSILYPYTAHCMCKTTTTNHRVIEYRDNAPTFVSSLTHFYKDTNFS